MTIAVTETRPDVSYTNEGDGVVATCTGCGWEAWRETRASAESAAADHKKCRADDVALYARNKRVRSASRQSRNPNRLTPREG